MRWSYDPLALILRKGIDISMVIVRDRSLITGRRGAATIVQNGGRCKSIPFLVHFGTQRER